jgi:NAD(P)-dependent dehydrogenase (short-subunit alcohol dehydrogenase family)
MDFHLQDKVVLVTGAGAGIGLAIAKAFIGEGAVVIGAEKDPENVEELNRIGATALELDMLDPDGGEKLAQAAIDAHGRIDVLVNNVGRYPIREGFLAVTDSDWRSTLDINFGTMVRATRAVLPHMVARESGSIVSIASEVARQPEPFIVDYSASKAAVLSASKAISIEFGPKGIRANCVSPGPIRVENWEAPGGYMDLLSEQHGLGREEALLHLANEVRRLPLGRVGLPENVAAVVCFLASDQAANVTGSEYAVNGGSQPTL